MTPLEAVFFLSLPAKSIVSYRLALAGAASQLIRLAAFRDAVLSAGPAINALVSTVMMATLVVGPSEL